MSSTLRNFSRFLYSNYLSVMSLINIPYRVQIRLNVLNRYFSKPSFTSWNNGYESSRLINILFTPSDLCMTIFLDFDCHLSHSEFSNFRLVIDIYMVVAATRITLDLPERVIHFFFTVRFLEKSKIGSPILSSLRSILKVSHIKSLY